MSTKTDISTEELVSLFSKAGFEEKKSAEIVKNKKVASALYNILGSNFPKN